jgi:tetratricopeptide (TPR) repeat protein
LGAGFRWAVNVGVTTTFRRAIATSRGRSKRRALAAVLLLCAPALAHATDFDLCDKLADHPDDGIPACTRLLEPGVTGVNQAAVYNNRGTGWYLKGFYDNAIADFSEAIQRNPKYTVAFQNRGRAWHKKAEYDRAIQDFREALRLDPKNATAFTDRGSSLLNKAEFDLALSDFSQAIKLEPKYPLAYLGRAEAFSGKKNFTAALADLNQAELLMPNQPTVFNNRAAVLIETGQLDRAIADYDKAIALDPANWRPYSGRGEAWRLKGDVDRALNDHDKAIELNPNSVDAYNNRALAYRDKGDLDRALADYDSAILLDPRYSRAYGNRGEIWRLKGDLDRSLSDLDRAIAITPTGPVYYAFRGETWRYKEQLDRSIADFDEALRLSRDDVAALTGRGLTYEKKKDLVRARADFRKALELPVQRDPSRAIPAQETARSHLAALDAADAKRVAAGGSARAEQKRLAAAAAGSPTHVLASTGIVSKPSKRVALIIGNSEYRNVASLQNAARDADTVAAALRKAGFQTVSLDMNLTREKMYDELRNFSALAESADWAFVYYAGHGIEIGGTNYLIPTDAKLTTDRDVQFETIPLEQVLAAVEPAREIKLVILDSCRDNPFAKTMRVSNAARSIGRGLARVEPSGATLVVYAAKHGQVAMDGNGTNSPFASSFVQRMLTPGIEINKLFRLVRDDVMDLTHGKQEPFTYGSLPGREDFYFLAGQ